MSARVRFCLGLLILLSLQSVVIAQESYVIVDSVRLPAESYVGDPVELRYTIRTDGAATVPEEIPQPLWGEISMLRILPRPGGFDLRLTATPFQPGTLALPALRLGDVRLDGLSLIVQSILPAGGGDVRPALRPQRLPGTRAALLFIGLGVSFAVALAFYLVGPGRRHIVALVNRYRSAAPYRHLVSRVHHLERDIRNYSVRDFYIELSREIQVFMASRTGHNCIAATSTELIATLPQLELACGAVPGTAEPLAEIIRASDTVKFQRRSIRQKKRIRHLEVVNAVATELETHRRRLGRRTRSGKSRVSAAQEKSRVGA